MTNLVVTTENTLTQVKSPALPFAPVEYLQKYQDELNNILRLYFTQIDALAVQLSLGKVYAFADLPTAASAGVGARAFVTDSSVSTFGTAVAGGGTSKVPVYSDGTSWMVG